jgi:hypothetical protein
MVKDCHYFGFLVEVWLYSFLNFGIKQSSVAGVTYLLIYALVSSLGSPTVMVKDCHYLGYIFVEVWLYSFLNFNIR